MAAQFELTKNEQGEHHFVLRAPNGDPILTSEAHAAKAAALAGIELVRTSSAADDNFRRRTSAAGQPYFVLLAPKGEMLGTSQMYATPLARENGVRAVKLNAPIAAIDDKA